MTKDEFVATYGIEPHKDILRGNNIATAALYRTCTNPKHKIEPTEYGISYCEECYQEAISEEHKPKATYEMVPEYIKEDRKKNMKSQIQSHRQGELSKEFVELYPQRIKGMLKEGVITHEQVRKAKRVWKGDIPNYDNLHKTK